MAGFYRSPRRINFAKCWVRSGRIADIVNL